MSLTLDQPEPANEVLGHLILSDLAKYLRRLELSCRDRHFLRALSFERDKGRFVDDGRRVAGPPTWPSWASVNAEKRGTLLSSCGFSANCAAMFIRPRVIVLFWIATLAAPRKESL